MKTYLFVAVVLALGSVAAVCGNPWDDDDGGSGGARVPADRRIELAPVDELELIVRESFPPQYAVRIVSGLPSGCAEFHDVETARAGNTFTITVRNTMPADPNAVCTAIYGMHEETVELGRDLVSGTQYTVAANDKELTFTAE